MSISVKDTNWLAEIGKMEPPSTYIHLSNLNGLTAEKANAAIEATYGPSFAVVHDHGTVLWGNHLKNIADMRKAKVQ